MVSRYRIELLGQERQFDASKEESLLTAGLSQGIPLPYGCQSGGCGACRAQLIKGEIAYPYEPPALSEAEKAAGYILLCQAEARSDLQLQVQERLGDQHIPVSNLPVRVEKKQSLCHDVMQLILKLPKGESFEFLAGQYVDFLLRDGRRRSFSIANAPDQKGFIELHLRHVPDGEFSDFIFNSMQDRAILRIEGPLGGFYLRQESARPLLFMAGGTGLAPIKSMLEYLQAGGKQRPAHLFWGARQERDLYFHEQLLSWSKEWPWLDYTPVLSEAEEAWSGETGFVHRVLAREYPKLANHDVYMSGPPVMVQAAREQFFSQGLPVEQLFYDSFDYAFQTWPEREKADPR